MYPLDQEVFNFFNHFAGRNSYLDGIIIFISANHLFKGGVFVLLIWFLWFKKGDKKVFRPLILINLVGCFITMFAARIMAKFLPFRMRPIHNSSIDISMPIGLDESYAEGLSSFPSDHAALFFALATGIYFLNKKLGVFALLYALFIICLPRIYLGLHYPSDIAAGALLGVIIIALVHNLFGFHRLNGYFFKVKKAYPSVFYAFFFLITYQIADMFESVRAIITFGYHMIAGGNIEL
jgi:undecaprenyl-diphosphatase